ncbi:hypothetical protein HY024_01930, partial [Candidatus Curtissbacteria bacterium]|nr:hypothetical protein [Candidatus Curtissbacteria bacterium]
MLITKAYAPTSSELSESTVILLTSEDPEGETRAEIKLAISAEVLARPEAASFPPEI